MSEEPPQFPIDESSHVNDSVIADPKTHDEQSHLEQAGELQVNVDSNLPPEARSLADLAIAESEISADSQRELSNGLEELLGKFSLATAELKGIQNEVEQGKEARRILERIAEIIPSYTRYDEYAHGFTGFTIESDNPQYTVRKLQTHVLWLREKWNSSDRYKKDAIPYYIIGRQLNQETAGLVLLKAHSLRPKNNETPEIKLVNVKKDDLFIRDRIIEGLEVRDLTDEERDKLVNAHSGALELKPTAAGNIHITDRSRFRARTDEKDVREDGVQLAGSYEDCIKDITNKELMDLIKAAQVDRYLTKLIIDFGLEEKYLDILNGKDEQSAESPAKTGDDLEEKEVAKLANSKEYTAKALEALGEAETEPIDSEYSSALWARANAYASFAALARINEQAGATD